MLWLAAAFFIASSVSCSGSSSATSVDSVPENLLPLDAFFFEAERAAFQRQVLELENREIAMQECLIAEGFSYVPQLVEGTPAQNPQRGPEHLRVNGYGISTSIDESFVGSLNLSSGGLLVEGLSESELAAGQEASENCLKQYLKSVSESEAEQRTEDQVLIEEYNRINEDYQASAGADPRLLVVFEGWSRCMSELGYPPFETPRDSFDLVTEYVETEPDAGNHQEYELQVAGDDADCQEEAKLFELVAELEKEFVEENQRLLELMALAGLSPDR